MANNIAVQITADVADLTAKSAIARADMAATTKALNDLAKQARGTAMTTELKISLLQAGDAAAKAKSQYAEITREMAKMRPAAEGAAHGSAGVTRELLVMGRELSRGNFNRMAGSATILAGRLGVLTPAVIMTVGAIAALAAPFVAFAVAAEQGSQEAAKFKNAIEATNGYAGVTESQLQNLSRSMATWAHVGIGAANEALMKIVASGHFSGDTMRLVGEDAVRMGQLTGQSADKFIDDFDKMKSGVAKFAQEYNDQYHQLSLAQVEYIRTLEEQGRKEEAEYALAQNVYNYLGKQAPQNLGYLESAWNNLTTAVSGAWDAMKAIGRNSNQDQIDDLNQRIALMKRDPNANKGGAVSREIAGLERQLQLVQQREASEQRAAASRAEQARTQSDGVDAAARLAEKFEASKTSGEKLKKAIADINNDLAKAVKADPANAARYEAEAAAARAQAQKSDTPHAPKVHDDIVAQWTEQLHAQEIASKDFFKNNTADELAFWQSKLALVAKGSKDWLAVQTKIYELSKTMAHQAYDAQIADYNDKIAADRDNWSKELADIQAKLSYVKSTQGEQSRAYKDAHRELETAQREHDDRELREAQEHTKRLYDDLKIRIDAQAKARDDDARAAEAVVKGNAGATPFGEIAAQRQLAEIHRQLTEQKIADNETLYAHQSSGLQADIDKAAALYDGDQSKYQALLDAKAKADQQYAARKQELDAQLRMQSIQDMQALQNTYASYISGTVNATVTGFSKMIGGQESWRNFGISIYQSMVREAEQQIEKLVTNWIVQHVFMTAEQRAELAAQKAAHAANEAAKTATTTTSTAAQTSAVVAGGATQTAAMMATTKAQVALLAGLAGAGGVASMAAAPWPIDMTAPAFGASMAASAMSFGAFEKGLDIVPNDMIAQVHEGERIIPKADNSALINLAARGAGMAAGAGSAGGAAGGDTHNHFAPVIHANGVDPKSVMQALESNFGDFTSLLKRAARNGAFR